ncbi:MAG: hypothetical protein CL678_11250 [Bdellovibrionaceae bacterium]|nr:hypothetical protein [Pseudobdellovibrionaceae bacterium]|tara:strand:- start:656 stop:955 length:300 start_codon:yes stop_codon:yes gene_type:complete
MDDLKKKLTTELNTCTWSFFKPHYERDSLFLVDHQLDLVEVAYSIATNNVLQVETYLQKRLMKKPTQEEFENYLNENEEHPFLIVQPFVLVHQKKKLQS